MNLRSAVYELSAKYKLDAKASAQLRTLAGLDIEPPMLLPQLARGVAMLAAALGGFGLILWIAANWDDFGRAGRFTLLEGVVVTTSLAAILRPAARAPFALLALLAIGALLAYFGQTYQTGADLWQLFALWSALALPLCMSTRSDALWTPWALVSMTAISLWMHAHTGHGWRVRPNDIDVDVLTCAATVALSLALSPLGARYTGAGPWALRTSVSLTCCQISLMALLALFSSDVGSLYWIGLIVLVAMMATLARGRLHDIFGVSVAGLALNGLAVAGLGHALLDRTGGDHIGAWLLLGLAAAAMLAVTVHLILNSARQSESTRSLA